MNEHHLIFLKLFQKAPIYKLEKFYKLIQKKIKLFRDKAKPFVKRGRKATGLKEIAGLPECGTDNRVTFGNRVARFFLVNGAVTL